MKTAPPIANDLEGAIAFAGENRHNFVRDIDTLVRIPSISTLPDHAPDVRRAAETIAQRLRGLGVERVDLVETARHPVVTGEWLGRENAPTVLVYGHYDVQPADPLDQWKSDPFEPKYDGDYMIGRGASDMKAQLVAFLSALECCVRHGGLPVNLKFVIEGEEEIASENLPAFIEEHKEWLRADCVLNLDGHILGADKPSLLYAVRGVASYELRIQTLAKDAHSGRYGGAVPNAAHVMADFIAGLHDTDGRIAIPGFYDDVTPLSDDMRAQIASSPIGEAELLANAGAEVLVGEPEYTGPERCTARPTLEVNGFTSGFQGAGRKTIVPSTASAKFSARLVPDQTPERVNTLFAEYVERTLPKGVKYELTTHPASRPALMALDNPYLLKAADALRDTFGKAALFAREGGSIHVIGMLQSSLGLDTILMGFALPDDGIHSPNERQHLPTFFNGIESYIRFLHGLGAR